MRAPSLDILIWIEIGFFENISCGFDFHHNGCGRKEIPKNSLFKEVHFKNEHVGSNIYFLNPDFNGRLNFTRLNIDLFN